MLRRMILSAALVVGCAGIAKAAAQDDIQSALQKLVDSPNYSWKTSWKTTVTGGFGADVTDGKTQKEGLTTLSITQMGNTYQVVIQGNKRIVKTDDGWKSTAELIAGGGGGGGKSMFLFAMTVQYFKTPVAPALDLVGKLQNVHKTDDGYTADLSDDAAKQALTFRRRPQNAVGQAPTVSNAKASIKVWIKDGLVSRMENHLTGTVNFNGNDREIDRTTTTEFTDVGSTIITVPDEAKAKLSALPAPTATQP